MNFIKGYTYLALFLFPIYTVSFLPLVYSPASALLVAPLGVLIFLFQPTRLDKTELLLLLLAGYILIISVFNLINYNSNLFNFLKESAPLFVGVFSYIFFIRACKPSLANRYFKILLISGYSVLIYGVIEYLALKGIVPHVIRNISAKIFSGVVTGRVQLVMREASWAAEYLFYLLPIIIFFSDRFKTFFLGLCIVFIILTFSLKAIIISGMAYYFYIYYFTENRAKLLRQTISLIFILFVGSILVYFCVKFYIQSGGENAYHLVRVLKMAQVSSFESVLLLDGSVYLRVMYPYYAILIGLEYPLGVGVGHYGVIFNSLFDSFPFHEIGLTNGEVRGDIGAQDADPRGFYTALFAYGGFIGLGIFTIFISKIIKSIKFIEDIKVRKALALILFLSLASGLQTGSLAFFPLWFSAALIRVHAIKK